MDLRPELLRPEQDQPEVSPALCDIEQHLAYVRIGTVGRGVFVQLVDEHHDVADAEIAPLEVLTKLGHDAREDEILRVLLEARGLLLEVVEDAHEIALPQGREPVLLRLPGLDDDGARRVLERVKEMEHSGYQFEAADGKGEAKISVRVPRDGSSPQLDISAQVRDLNAASTPKYLPANTLPSSS